MPWRSTTAAVQSSMTATMMRLHCDKHPTLMIKDPEGNITHAEFDIESHWAGPYDYVRISLVDCDGKKAWTNPIFLEEDT